CMADINKEGAGRAYPGSLSEARTFKKFADAQGKRFGYGGIILTHGECDSGNANYEAELFLLWSDYNQDLKGITGKPEDIVLLASQQSTIPGVAGLSSSEAAVWRGGVDHPGQIVCTGPKYQYQYAADNLHFDAVNYRRLGEKYAEVFDEVFNKKKIFRPLQP